MQEPQLFADRQGIHISSSVDFGLHPLSEQGSEAAKGEHPPLHAPAQSARCSNHSPDQARLTCIPAKQLTKHGTS